MGSMTSGRVMSYVPTPKLTRFPCNTYRPETDLLVPPTS